VATILTAGVVVYVRSDGMTQVHRFVPAAAPLPPPSSSDVMILAGSSARNYTDQLGHVWSPDRFFDGGESWPVRYRRILRTDDPQLFLTARQGGEFGYDIPLAAGLYELRLYFAETFYGNDNSEGGGEFRRMFDVTANDAPLLTDFEPAVGCGRQQYRRRWCFFWNLTCRRRQALSQVQKSLAAQGSGFRQWNPTHPHRRQIHVAHPVGGGQFCCRRPGR
jgi:hypothetical protein